MDRLQWPRVHRERLLEALDVALGDRDRRGKAKGAQQCAPFSLPPPLLADGKDAERFSSLNYWNY